MFRHILIFILTILVFINASFAGLPPTTVKGQSETSPVTTFNFQVPYNQATTTGAGTRLFENGYNNLLKNASAEHATATTDWNFGTLTSAGETGSGNFIDGKKSIKLTVSAQTGSLMYQQYTPGIDYTGINMEAGLWVKTSLATLQVCALLVSTTTGCVNVLSDNKWHYYPVNYPGTNAAQGVTLYAASSTTGDIYVDGGYVGLARNIGTVQTSSFLGGLDQAGTSGCSYLESSSTGANDFDDLPAGTGCSAWTSVAGTGTVTAVGTNDHRFTVTNMPPGMNKVEFNGFVYMGANGACTFKLSDGTNTYNPQSLYFSATGAIGSNTLIFHVPTTASTSPTFKVVASDTHAGACGIINDTVGYGASWRVYNFPSQGQTGVRMDQSNFDWTTCPSISGSWVSNTTYTCLYKRRGSMADFDIRLNTTGAPTSATLTINLPVTIDTTKGNFSAGNSKLNESSGSILDAGSSQYDADVYYNTTTTVAPVAVNSANTYGVPTGITQAIPMTWANGDNLYLKFSVPVVGWLENQNAPLLVGGVTSNTTGMERVERARLQITSASACTVISESGDWLGTCTASSSDATIPINSGIFSGAPACSGVGQGSANAFVRYGGAMPTSTSLSITHRDTSNAASTAQFDIICMGPR